VAGCQFLCPEDDFLPTLSRDGSKIFKNMKHFVPSGTLYIMKSMIIEKQLKALS